MSTRLSAISILMLVSAAAGCEEKKQPVPSAASAPAASVAAPKAKLNLPHDLGKVSVPADNPQSDAKVKLGHQLFFDKRLSKDGTRACYSCHMNENGNGGKEPKAIGAEEKQLTRHSPVIWNVGYLGAFYWDGRAGSLEAQAIGAWGGGNMGVGKDNLEAKAKEIAAIAGYKKQFDEAFPKEGVTPDTIAKAIAAYERTLVCDDTKYDKYAKGDEKALSGRQVKGLELFMGKAGCSVCHAPPHFSTAYGVKEGVYFNVGVGTKDVKAEDVDVGRKKISEKDADWAAFKVPTLRNVSKSAPYFHDGSVASLEEAIRLMASSGVANEHKSPVLTDKKLSDDEVESITDFLAALDCEKTLTEPELPK